MRRLVVAGLIALAPLSGALAAETVIYAFKGGPDGQYPLAGLIADDAGVLYGTTINDQVGSGAVFKLTPPAAGKTAWTETVLDGFLNAAAGEAPSAGLTLGAHGVLYGTTKEGGAHAAGLVFELTPPAKGKTAWTETVLYNFKGGSDGDGPAASLIADKSGALYGTTTGGTSGNGTVFKLTPPAAGKTAWTETVLHRFQNTDGAYPAANLIFDGTGGLYGTASKGGAHGAGTVFKLTPPAAGKIAWVETILYNFTGSADGDGPTSGLTLDKAGFLYGSTTIGGAHSAGVIYRLKPPATGRAPWTETVLYSCAGGADDIHPTGTLIMDSAGVLYGATGGDGDSGPPGGVIMGLGGALYGTATGSNFSGIERGTVFKLTPPAAGKTAWTRAVLHNFANRKSPIYGSAFKLTP